MIVSSYGSFPHSQVSLAFLELILITTHKSCYFWGWFMAVESTFYVQYTLHMAHLTNQRILGQPISPR